MLYNYVNVSKLLMLYCCSVQDSSINIFKYFSQLHILDSRHIILIKI